MAKNTGLSDEKLNYAVRYAQFITSYNVKDDISTIRSSFSDSVGCIALVSI